MAQILHQLRLVVYPIIYRVLYIQGGAGFCPSIVVSCYQYCVQVFFSGIPFRWDFIQRITQGNLAKTTEATSWLTKDRESRQRKMDVFFVFLGGERLGMFFIFVVSDFRSRRKLFWCFLFLLFQILDAGFRKGEYICIIYIGTTPHPVTVTTRIIPFLVGNPYKPSFATVTGWGVDLKYIDQPST